MAIEIIVACRVYGLSSSEDGEIRYIGQTTKKGNRRLREHICEAMRGGQWPLCKWIRKVIARGHSIQFVVLVSNAVLNETETQLIAGYRSNGSRLLNCTDGGEGFVGWKPTGEQRIKMRDAAKRRMQSVEGRTHASMAGKAAWLTPNGIALRKAAKQKAAAERERKSKFVGLTKQQIGRLSHQAMTPEQIAKTKASIIPKTPEQKAAISEHLRRLWATPEYRARMTASATASWTPKKREAARQRALNRTEAK
jgi:hypothetical protein